MKPKNRKPAPIKMWAIKIINPKSTWINWTTIASTRRQAIEKYDEGWADEHWKYRKRSRSGYCKATRVEVRPL